MSGVVRITTATLTLISGRRVGAEAEGDVSRHGGHLGGDGGGPVCSGEVVAVAAAVARHDGQPRTGRRHARQDAGGTDLPGSQKKKL